MFDRVAVINLDRRKDRWDAFCAQLPQPWLWSQPERVSALDGQSADVPDGWQSGPGAYGCLRSHLQLLREADDKRQSLFVLEDDAVFCDGFTAKASLFLDSVPNDWDMIYFGGSHIIPPYEISDGVCRCLGVKKTHAYAIRGEALLKAIALLKHATTHIDVVLSRFHHAFRVYAPTRWLCGQSAGVSDILSGSSGEPERWFGGAA